MANSEEPMFAGFNLSSGQAILKDIMLLENQIPWLVLEALIKFLPVNVHHFVTEVGDKFFPKEKDSAGWILWFKVFLMMKC
jgi:hypothetical protein